MNLDRTVLAVPVRWWVNPDSNFCLTASGHRTASCQPVPGTGSGRMSDLQLTGPDGNFRINFALSNLLKDRWPYTTGKIWIRLNLNRQNSRRHNSIYNIYWLLTRFKFVRLLTQLFPSNLEVHFTSMLSWPARNINMDVYLQRINT